MSFKEIYEVIFSYLLEAAIFILAIYLGIYFIAKDWAKNKSYFIINTFLLFLYSIIFINGRINDSQHGGALVWDFYFTILLITHFIITLIITFIVKLKSKPK